MKVGQHLFLSGQIPLDAAGNLVDGSVGKKTEACCESVKAILAAAGSGIDKVFKVSHIIFLRSSDLEELTYSIIQTTVFITDMSNFAEVNEVYEKYFSHKPARSCVAVYQLPKGVPVEIECIALA